MHADDWWVWNRRRKRTQRIKYLSFLNHAYENYLKVLDQNVKIIIYIKIISTFVRNLLMKKSYSFQDYLQAYANLTSQKKGLHIIASNSCYWSS